MKVKELIEELQKHHPDKIVLVTAYESGFDELGKVVEVKVLYKPSSKHWEGDYNDYPPDECLTNAILLPRL